MMFIVAIFYRMEWARTSGRYVYIRQKTSKIGKDSHSSWNYHDILASRWVLDNLDATHDKKIKLAIIMVYSNYVILTSTVLERKVSYSMKFDEFTQIFSPCMHSMTNAYLVKCVSLTCTTNKAINVLILGRTF